MPAIIVSPYAKRGFVDHTVYDMTSILRFIEWRWGLDPLGERDASANNLLAAFDFTQSPRQTDVSRVSSTRTGASTG